MFNKLIAKRKAGFTLVEILVVILIIGLLFVFLVPKIDSSMDKAREAGIKTDMRSYQTAFESVARDRGGLGENAITDVTEAIRLVNGYLDPALKVDGSQMSVLGNGGYDVAKLDPWNNPYIFEYDGKSASNNGYMSIRTIGKDMRDSYSWANLYWAMTSYQLDKQGRVYAGTQCDDRETSYDNCLDNDLEWARTAGDPANGSKVDDYVLGTWYLDGQLYTATAGFTTNIESGIAAQ